MKKTLILIALVLSTFTAFAQDGKSIYRKYSDEKGISAVYISPAMFRLIGRLPDINTGDGEVNLTPVIKGLTGLYIINSGNPAINSKIAKDVNKFIDSGAYEMLMEAKDEGEVVRMYTSGDDTTVTSFVLLTDEGSELTFICLDGSMEREKLENLIAEQMK
ncbi:MAG: DUF4252 domain-containing protein [Bacteroidales bacterium]|nr:DUF4252 domain-containing protein [Bacteroidales bacterium]